MQYFQKSKNGSRKYRLENLPSKSELQKSIQKGYELGKKVIVIYKWGFSDVEEKISQSQE